MKFPLYYYSTICFRCGSNDTYEDTGGFHCNSCKFNTADIPNHWKPYPTSHQCERCGDNMSIYRTKYCRNCQIELYDKDMKHEISNRI